MRSRIIGSAKPGTVRLLALAAVACVTAATAMGCGVYQAGIRTGPAASESLPQRDPAEVRLFGGEDPSLVTEEVGFVVGVSDVDEEWLALRRLKSAAAKLGADAVIDLRFEVVQSSQLVARGRAVKLAAAPAAAPAAASTGGQP